ncbi:hypothetical protein C2G38_2115835 [Gigaspora rosea]|uniref:SPRY domain-containing protein n=1 Tax=Gigaspora rosea TaxID=44941 RepID=A0A397U8Q1_9GLOM|nr:hypothetical protein C2G38_2115835 [Gigaspora rosea]
MQSDKKIDNSNYLNNMLMLGQKHQENESWEFGYHGNNKYSFYSGSGGPYEELYTTNGIACHLYSNFKGILYPCIGFRLQGGSVKVNFGNENFKYSGKYDKVFEDLTKLLEIEPNNTIALRYRGEINYIMKRYKLNQITYGERSFIN